MNKGHGTVTLPADYVHDHVRLGCAATEHGYQSDTVDHSLALVSSVTTRRGLYVAATRGRDNNLLCVVTDSDDVAEARDSLEVILAFDRADVPSRCEIPDWFEPLRAGLRRDLFDATQALTASAAERARLAAEATAAERDLVGIDAATTPARRALAAATSHYEEAWRHQAYGQHHLDHSGVRGRRAARRDHDAAVIQLDEATEHLERTRRHTTADVECYHQARTRADETATALHRHDMRQQLNPPSITSLDCDDRSNRSTCGVVGLAATPSMSSNSVTSSNKLTSSSRRDEYTDQFQTLGQTVRDWVGDAGIDLPTATRHGRTLQRAGPELGL